ncbi:hypothetical protein KM043_016816 [Ampulex compressa]|nr:hypothetical protein KM043_016816 [Ampulex compressa]
MQGARHERHAQKVCAFTPMAEPREGESRRDDRGGGGREQLRGTEEGGGSSHGSGFGRGAADEGERDAGRFKRDRVHAKWRRQFVSDNGARKMLPVVHETGGPPSSRRRRCAMLFPGAPSREPRSFVEIGTCRYRGPTSIVSLTTAALAVLLISLPAAFPDMIPIVDSSVVRGYEEVIRNDQQESLRVIAVLEEALKYQIFPCRTYFHEGSGTEGAPLWRKAGAATTQAMYRPTNTINSTVVPDKGDRAHSHSIVVYSAHCQRIHLAPSRAWSIAT